MTAARVIPTPSLIQQGNERSDLGDSVRYLGPDSERALRLLSPALVRAAVEWKSDAASSVIEVVPGGPSRHEGGHRIEVAAGVPARIRLIAPGNEPLRHALVSLAQLISRFGRALPVVTIEDRPAIPTRGVMLDISRDKVPTMASLAAFVDQMEMLKLNHLQLYTEHTFAYAGHEEAWRGASPITPDEARELDARCRERGIELAANQNCLGHLHRWLRLPRYAPLAEIPLEDQEWTFESDDGRRFTKSGPFSLNPTDPQSLALIEDLLGQLLPCFTSDRVNIGCDEAFDIGQGRSRAEVEKHGRAAVYLDWLRAVGAIVKRHGKRTMFWADIAWRHPESRRLIPEGAVPLIWGYEADVAFGALARALSPKSLPWFCPGTSSWLSITGRRRTRHANLRAAARAAAEHRSGMLCCDWGDRGHRQHWPIALHAIAHAAHEAWTGGDPSRPFDARAAAMHFLGGESGELGDWLEELGQVDADLSERAELRNTNALFSELGRPLAESPEDQSRQGSMEDWQRIRLGLGSLRDRLASISSDELCRSELEHTLSVAEHAAEKGILCRACLDEPGGMPRGPARIRLAADLASVAEMHRELWPKRNRPGGLDDSAAHYERIIDDYEHAPASPVIG